MVVYPQWKTQDYDLRSFLFQELTFPLVLQAALWADWRHALGFQKRQ